ncbi:hypothetical protein FISHEDRAFT_75179 [Fistulina hepatica ATCC 64428]|uniref:Uncharacterized protein n=1 Tax=Fistulina hepatica ATCC 64428 TaxID=1128425 RepID=A0A0D7A954_9AGAR|nr:hypothetical protein FISHEDRAFT_75179 [Fistulina hepatica ATCC 64428]
MQLKSLFLTVVAFTLFGTYVLASPVAHRLHATRDQPKTVEEEIREPEPDPTCRFGCI